ncbi:MAG: hypothetical protein QNJ72_35515 [Pleurocapsa sp. MO_226.B13]|nr:hypothetical protein [Pleurocapsa sp. MO_226.B13]
MNPKELEPKEYKNEITQSHPQNTGRYRQNRMVKVEEDGSRSKSLTRINEQCLKRDGVTPRIRRRDSQYINV